MTNLLVKCQFEGFHRWPEAPAKHEYLRNFHRHIFHVEMYYPVTDLNRQVEFIDLKRRLEDYVTSTWGGFEKRHVLSCEMMAKHICETFKASWVAVMEDDENGAVYSGEQSLSKFVARSSELHSYVEKRVSDLEELIKDGSIKKLSEEPSAEVPSSQSIWTTPFCGIEAEGPFQGEFTLFIPGNYNSDISDMHKVMAQFVHLHKVFKLVRPNSQQRLYLGAGNCPLYATDNKMIVRKQLEFFINYFEEQCITIEAVPSIGGMGMVRHLMAYPKMTYVMNLGVRGTKLGYPYQYLESTRVNYVKYWVGKKIYWQEAQIDPNRSGPYLYETSINDPRFKTDFAV